MSRSKISLVICEHVPTVILVVAAQVAIPTMETFILYKESIYLI